MTAKRSGQYIVVNIEESTTRIPDKIHETTHVRTQKGFYTFTLYSRDLLQWNFLPQETNCFSSGEIKINRESRLPEWF